MSILKDKIAGVIILFNPDINVIENINSYIKNIDRLFIIDNSSENNDKLINTLKIHHVNFTYLPNKANLGIAHALNQGAHAALANGYEWLLTMDQDSRAEKEMISKMISCSNIANKEEIGIISPFHFDKPKHDFIAEDDCEETDTAMTSGNLLNLKAYKEVGDFEDKLFIDYVDHEYCLRLKRKKYKIIHVRNAILYHNLGLITVHEILTKKIKVTNHSAERRYYITRNRLYVINKYKKDFPAFYKRELRFLFQELIKIILFENNKLNKLKNIIIAVSHFQKKRFGKF